MAEFGTILPAGVVVPFAGAGSAPDGWELCDGRLVLKTDAKYRNLFLAIGITYGEAGGGTQFKLPDVNTGNLFIRGGTPDGVENTDTTKPNGLSNGNQSADHNHTGTGAGTISSATASGTSHTHSTQNATADHTHSTGYQSASHTHGGGSLTGGGHGHNTVTQGWQNATLSAGAIFVAGMPGQPATRTDVVGIGSTGSDHGHTGYTQIQGDSHYHGTNSQSSTSHLHSIASSGSHTHPVTGTIAVASVSLSNQSASHNHALTGDAETAPKNLKMQHIIKL